MLLVIHRYYALPDRADELLALRVRISAGLRSLGLREGQVGRAQPGENPSGMPPPEGPAVMAVWSVPTEAEAQHWIGLQGSSAAFRAVTVEQSAQVVRYEREAYDIVDPAPAWLRLNRYDARPGMAKQVLVTRRRGNAAMRDMGIPAGQTGVRSGRWAEQVPPSGDTPPVIWLATFSSSIAYQRETEMAQQAPEVQALQAAQADLLARCVVETYAIVVP